MVARHKIADETSKGIVPPRTFSELSLVSFLHPIDVDGRMLPVGTKGTVVGAYGDGVGYEIEVFEPFHAVVTVEASDLTG